MSGFLAMLFSSTCKKILKDSELSMGCDDGLLAGELVVFAGFGFAVGLDKARKCFGVFFCTFLAFVLPDNMSSLHCDAISGFTDVASSPLSVCEDFCLFSLSFKRAVALRFSAPESSFWVFLFLRLLRADMVNTTPMKECVSARE